MNDRELQVRADGDVTIVDRNGDAIGMLRPGRMYVAVEVLGKRVTIARPDGRPAFVNRDEVEVFYPARQTTAGSDAAAAVLGRGRVSRVDGAQAETGPRNSARWALPNAPAHRPGVVHALFGLASLGAAITTVVALFLEFDSSGIKTVEFDGAIFAASLGTLSGLSAAATSRRLRHRWWAGVLTLVGLAGAAITMGRAFAVNDLRDDTASSGAQALVGGSIALLLFVALTAMAFSWSLIGSNEKVPAGTS